MDHASAKLRGIGIWSAALRHADPDAITESVAELEALGYTAAWIPDVGGDVFAALDHLLDATTTLTVGSGILNIWRHDVADTVRWWSGLSDDRRRRVMLGLGVSHGPLIGEAWGRPLAVMGQYLDGLDAGGVAVERRCLAALGSKMLELAGARTAGAHPYLVTPEHTAQARRILGDGLLAVEQGVVLDADPATARATGRQALEHYCGLPNYVNNWKRLGFTQDDVDQRSDRLVDALVAWGTPGAIATRVDAHLQAGADHVCIQVLSASPLGLERDAWRDLAQALV